MHFVKISLLAAGLFVFGSCRKEKGKAGSKTEDCVTSASVLNGKAIEGQYIISYKNTVDAPSSTRAVVEMSKEVLQENRIEQSVIKASFLSDAGGFVATLSPEQAQTLKNDPLVEAVEPDRIVALSTCFRVVEPTLVTWNANRVGYGDGSGKTVWVVDTGIDFDHPDLNVDQTRSKSFVTGVTSADDDNGHGTHVAGIIGARNNGFGILGIASGAQLVSLRVLDKEGIGKLSYMIQALSYISANARPGDVVNMSLGEEEVSDILDQQVQAIAAKGIYFAIAAGNDNKAANLFSPGRANGANIFTVSAVDSLDHFASFSNFGNDVIDYAAPGVRILSTYKDGLYAKMSGTSMATPHLAGLLLLKGKNFSHSGTAVNDPDGTPDRIAHK